MGGHRESLDASPLLIIPQILTTDLIGNRTQMYTGFYGLTRMKFIPTTPFVSIRSQRKKDADERGFCSMSGIIFTPHPNYDEL